MISNRKSNISTGIDTIRNKTNFVDIHAEPKIKKLVQPANNKKYENKEDSIFTDQEVERREEDITEKERSQLHNIDCVELLDALNFNIAAVDHDHVNYVDQSV